MRPDNVRAVVVEDLSFCRAEITKNIESLGGSVVGESETLDGALDLIDSFDEIKPNLILLDCNLDQVGAGYEIASKIAETGFPVHVMSISSSPAFGQYFEHCLDMKGADVQELSARITELADEPQPLNFLAARSDASYSTEHVNWATQPSSFENQNTGLTKTDKIVAVGLAAIACAATGYAVFDYFKNKEK